MNKQEDHFIANVMAQYALDEAEKTQAEMESDMQAMREADDMYHRGTPRALGTISRGVKKSSRRSAMLLRAAACIAVLIAGTLAILRPTAPDTKPYAVQSTVVPYVTQVPSIIPADWTGEYYLSFLPSGANDANVTSADEQCSAQYGTLLTFTEYAEEAAIDVTEGADAHYVSVNDTVALIMINGDTCSIAWTIDDRTLLVTFAGDEQSALALARGVSRVK